MQRHCPNAQDSTFQATRQREDFGFTSLSKFGVCGDVGALYLPGARTSDVRYLSHVAFCEHVKLCLRARLQAVMRGISDAIASRRGFLSHREKARRNHLSEQEAMMRFIQLLRPYVSRLYNGATEGSCRSS